MARAVALLLTVLTGFSGLVYQVAWQKVLASLLGSHAEATAAVLGLYLGGLSLGYALFGRVCRRLAARSPGRRPGVLVAYGLAEVGVGATALLFPWLFAAIQSLSLLLPQLTPALGFSLDVGLAALLVLPPTILMGGTIPLLTQALSRDLEDSTRLHSLVYAFNTAGAFLGALAAGFVLVPWLGLEVTIRSMGVVNLAAGAAFLAMRRSEVPGTASEPARARQPAREGNLTAYAAVALLSGFAMMTLQTGLNRIGALALGASPFTFSIVVATFVLCIALGSFAVAAVPKIPSSALPFSQWTLVGLLLLLYPAMENVPYWAHRLRLLVGEDAGVVAHQASVFVSLMAVALVPLALSGALLPLLFHHLRNEPADLGRVAGRLYAWNTMGALLGALLGGYLLLLWLDLDALFRLAVLALAVAAALLTPRARLAGPSTAAVALCGVACIVWLQPAWEPRRLAIGLFRARLPAEHFARGPDAFFESEASRWLGDEVLFHRDDPVTSVTVTQTHIAPGRTARSVLVNGKVDGNVPADKVTMGLVGLLPALFAERAETAFVIGWGTGMTVGELAALDGMREVVVAEISPGVMDAARFFEDRNRAPLANPGTRVVRSDAYRALLRDEARYDVIVSAPSNPWVTGIEMLYSVEFLRAARARLAPGGVYAQWFHTYETDAATVELVLRTYRAAFERVAVWIGQSTDLLILGFEDADREPDLARLAERFERADFRAQLDALSIASLPELLAHERLPEGVLHEMELPGGVHTLLHPVLGDAAARAFYRRADGEVPPGLGRAAAEVGARNSLVRRWRARFGRALPDERRLELLRETCLHSRSACATLFAQWQHERPDSQTLATSLAKARTDPRLEDALAPPVIDGLARLFGSDATAGRPASFTLARALSRVFEKYYHHAAPFDPRALRTAWRRCADSDPRCASGYERSLEIGVGSLRVTHR